MNIKKSIKNILTIKFDKAFGLDIGDRSIEIIELEKLFNFSAITYGRTELPEGVVENGKIINQSVLAENLKKLLKSAKPKMVSTNKVVVSLPESQVFVYCFPVDVKPKSGTYLSAIQEKVSTMIPINLNKTYWDYVEKPLADKTKKLIIFYCVPKDIANSYVKFCSSIGLEVISLCIESLNPARALLRSSSQQSLIIDIGSRTTSLSFFDSSDILNMSIVVPVAGEHMTEAIQEKLKIEKVEAEKNKIKFGFKSGSDDNIKSIILPILEDILAEVKSSINYYEESFKQKLDNIFVVGGSALLPNIADVMKENLGREVQVATSGYNINFKPVAGKSNAFPLFANVIGLGMLGASGEYKDMNILKKIPTSEITTISKLNLFNLGYLSKVNTIRTIINNKYILTVLIILIIIIFAILFQQAQNYGFASASSGYAGNSFYQW